MIAKTNPNEPTSPDTATARGTPPSRYNIGEIKKLHTDPELNDLN